MTTLNTFELVGDLIGLIKAGEIDAAIKKIGEAETRHVHEVFVGRQLAIDEVNRQIQKLLAQKILLTQAIKNLPDSEKVFAEAQIENICSEFLDICIAQLRNRKRELSRP